MTTQRYRQIDRSRVVSNTHPEEGEASSLLSVVKLLFGSYVAILTVLHFAA